MYICFHAFGNFDYVYLSIPAHIADAEVKAL